MDNLAVQVIVDNSQPPLQLNSNAQKKITQAITESFGGVKNVEGNTIPTSFSGDINNARHQANIYNYQEYVVKKMAKKKFMTLESDGRGENKYLTNPFDTTQALTMKDRLKEELLSDLYISPVIYKADLAVGAKTGIALKRLKETTLKHVDRLRDILRPIFQRLAFNILETAKEAQLDNTNYEIAELPSVIYSNTEINDTLELIEEWKLRVENGFNTELQAVEAVNDLEEEQAQNLLTEIKADKQARQELAMQTAKAIQPQNQDSPQEPEI
jgi:hypothetical protein